MKWEFSYKYEQADASERHDKFRLDQIDGWEQQHPALNWLPSNMALLQKVVDNENAHATHAHHRYQTMGTRLAMGLGKYSELNFSYAADHRAERYHYASHSLDSTIQRKVWLHSFNAEYIYSRKCRSRLFYYFYEGAPAMSRLMPINNTYNPLAIVVGNPYLKNQQYQGVAHDFSMDIGKHRLINVFNNVGVRFYQNEVAMAVNYNRETGVYTYRPECVNGNYRIFVHNAFGFRFKHVKQLTINNELNYDYLHNVDLYLPENAANSLRSTVGTHQLSETFKANYDFGKLQLGWLTKVEYRYATSLQNNFADIHATDICYGINVHYDMPWKLKLVSDFKIYSRRGYDSAEMNTDDFVWNIALSRAIMKGKLNFKLQGFDILHNLNNVTYQLNGQGRMESWRRSIPNYWMLHVQWRFNKNPKRRI